MNSLTIYVVRHGECQHNVAKRIAGQNDTPLTDKGRAQARDAGRIWRALHTGDDIDFYSSPLHRAASTMEILRAEAGLPATGYVSDRRLMEIDCGDHTGLTWNEIVARAERDPRWHNDSWNYEHPRGESLSMLEARVREFLGGLSRNSVIATHAGVVRMIRGILLGLSHSDTLGYHPPHHGVLRFSGGAETYFGE